MKKYRFTGVVNDMHQHQKRTKSVNQPHTTFKIATDPVNQKIFEKIIKEIALGVHYAEIIIYTKKGKKIEVQ